MQNNDGLIRRTLSFNEYDFRHRKVLDIINSRPRGMTELVVNAVLHFVSCPDAETEFNKEAMKELVREVILEMQAEGSLGKTPAKGAASTLNEEDTLDLGGMMDAFRR